MKLWLWHASVVLPVICRFRVNVGTELLIVLWGYILHSKLYQSSSLYVKLKMKWCGFIFQINLYRGTIFNKATLCCCGQYWKENTRKEKGFYSIIHKNEVIPHMTFSTLWGACLKWFVKCYNFVILRTILILSGEVGNNFELNVI